LRRYLIVDLFMRRNCLRGCQAPMCIDDASQYL
jgi:hypothetical protein